VTQIKSPDGQVTTKEQTIKVDNHNSILTNAILRYGAPTVISALVVTGLAVLGIVGYIIHRIRRRSVITDQDLYNMQNQGQGPMPMDPTGVGGPTVNLPPGPFL
jgi:hypothetical protein